MKLAFFVLATLAAGEEERKVPPRTPPQRLRTLHRFSHDWIKNRIQAEKGPFPDGKNKGGINRPNRGERMKLGMDRIYEKMSDAYVRGRPEGPNPDDKQCSYFNPSVPHGGPDPAHGYKYKGRKRRSAWVQDELTRIARDVTDNDAIDIFDQMELAYEQGLGERGFLNLRLSDEPNLAWRQIETGFRKWALRYISECGGQKQYQYHTKRIKKIHGAIKDAYVSIGETMEIDYLED
jgi:hypothetical protein